MADALSRLPVAEVFGPTFQGEGPHCGRHTAFVRLGLCNLACSWCDTPYTWDYSRFDVADDCPETSIPTIHDRLRAIPTDTVTLTGGEPLMHHRFLDRLMLPEWEWHAETNGTIAPPVYWAALVEHTTVSPKINTGDPYAKRIKPAVLDQWNELAIDGRAAFKFVVTDVTDLDAVQDVVDCVGINPRYVWIMPEGVSAIALIARHRQLAKAILDRGFNTSTRLHTLLYEQERGR